MTASIALSCGGSTTAPSSCTDAGSNDANAGASGAADGGGTGGSSPRPLLECPPAAPDRMGVPLDGGALACPNDDASSNGCSYIFECSSGAQTVTYECGERGWQVADAQVATAPCLNGDFCFTRGLHCRSGSWEDYTGAGGDPPQPCPAAKPEPGSTCRFNYAPAFSPAGPCGYLCQDGTWTIGVCREARTSEGGIWRFDQACPGDCAVEKLALYDYAAKNQQCATDSDCVAFQAECALPSEHCSGVMYLGPSADASTWSELDAALATCALLPESTWPCSRCTNEPPPPRCIEGYCQPQPE